MAFIYEICLYIYICVCMCIYLCVWLHASSAEQPLNQQIARAKCDKQPRTLATLQNFRNALIYYGILFLLLYFASDILKRKKFCSYQLHIVFIALRLCFCVIISFLKKKKNSKQPKQPSFSCDLSARKSHAMEVRWTKVVMVMKCVSFFAI